MGSFVKSSRVTGIVSSVAIGIVAAVLLFAVVAFPKLGLAQTAESVQVMPPIGTSAPDYKVRVSVVGATGGSVTGLSASNFAA